MASWKHGASVRVMEKVNAGHVLTDFEYRTLRNVAGMYHLRPSPDKLLKPYTMTPQQETESFKHQISIERAIAPPDPKGGDYMLLPFARECEREADHRERFGLTAEQWYGKTKPTFFTNDTVSALFEDNEVRARPRHVRVRPVPFRTAFTRS